MSPAMASAIGGALMICAGVVAMATLSHCPRRWRVWPAMLLALGALYGSDRTLAVFFDSGYLSNARSIVIVAAMAAALGTVCALSWMIQIACPMCRKTRPAKSEIQNNKFAHGVVKHSPLRNSAHR